MNHPKIVVTPPGPKARELLRSDERLLSPSLSRVYPLVVQSGDECIVRDVDGNEFIDFSSGLSCLNVGNSHPAVIDSVKEQLDKFIHYSQKSFYYEVAVKLAQKLCDVTPGSFPKRVFFSNSGTEAVEAAIKIVRCHFRKTSLLAYTNASHGETFGSMSLSACKLVQKRYLSPLMPSVVHLPYPYCYRCPFGLSCPDCNYKCVDFIDEYILQRVVAPEDVAAIFFESIQVEGCITPAPDYFCRLRKLADEFEIALVDDETETGVGRTGRWFGIENWQVIPDVICIAGGISSGLPLGATLCRAEIMDWEPEVHSSTFGGNPLSCAAALAVFEVAAKDGLLENSTRQGNYILHRLREMMEKYELIGDVRGKGLMVGVELVKDKKSRIPATNEARDIVLKAFKHGVALRMSGSTIILTPPLIITRDLVDISLNILEGALKEFRSGL
jgi:4-aminobutyrate aminotransferase